MGSERVVMQKDVLGSLFGENETEVFCSDEAGIRMATYSQMFQKVLCSLLITPLYIWDYLKMKTLYSKN